MVESNYLGNPNLKKANIKVEWTKEEVEEYTKCMQDPQHFIEANVRIISLDEGEFLSKIVSAQVTAEIEELHILKPGITWSPNGEQLAFAVKSGASDALVIVDSEKSNSRFIVVLCPSLSSQLM